MVLPAGGLSAAINPLFPVAFDAAVFDKLLPLNKATLISKMMKINYANIHTFHKKGYWFKIRVFMTNIG